MSVIGFNNLPYQPVPDHVIFIQVNKRDTVDILQDMLNGDKPGVLFPRQVRLRDIARDNRTAIEPMRVRNIFICMLVAF